MQAYCSISACLKRQPLHLCLKTPLNIQLIIRAFCVFQMKWFEGIRYGKAVSVPPNSCYAHARTRGFRLNFVLANYIDVFEPDGSVLYNSEIKVDVHVI
jgi:hypothetical protein